MHFSTYEASRCWQGNTEGCTRLKPELEAEKRFSESPAYLSPFVQLIQNCCLHGGKKKECWHFLLRPNFPLWYPSSHSALPQEIHLGLTSQDL